MTSLVIVQLCVGWLVRENGIVIEARSTSSIVLGAKHVIVVDTSDRSLRSRIIASLEGLGISVDDVDIVVNTHLHPDHTSNNDLFPNARVLAHEAEGRSTIERDMIGAGIVLEEGVRIVHTPGHTPGAISVFVDAEKRTAMVGDAIPTRENFIKRMPPALNYDQELARESMERIISWAEVIIPGHGPAFDVMH